jgi:hypothetical protein
MYIAPIHEFKGMATGAAIVFSPSKLNQKVQKMTKNKTLNISKKTKMFEIGWYY